MRCVILVLAIGGLLLSGTFAPTISLAEDEAGAWIELSVDPDDAAWREEPKPGWSAAGGVHLDAKDDGQFAVDAGDGVLVSRGESNLYTAREFDDAEVRLEFLIPRGSNSGVKLCGLYEIQILDTHGKPVEELTGDSCGGVYPRAELGPPYKYLDDGVSPRVNAARPAGEWQTLEIRFRAPRFDDSGKKIAHARFERVVLNSEVVHKNVELDHPTGHAWNKEPEIARGPLMLQGDHGQVAFRKLAIRPLDSE